MDRNTFFGASIKLVISQIAISKSICGNLNKRLKNRGIRNEVSRLGSPFPYAPLIAPDRGRLMVGFCIAWRSTIAAFEKL